MIKKLLMAFATVISLATFQPAYSMDTKLIEAVKAVPQIDDNCSASVIYSKRDEKSGEVKTILLTAKHCVDDATPTTELYADFPAYQNNRIIKKNRYIAHKLGQSYKSDVALMELTDKSTLFETTIKLGDSKNIQMGDDTVAIGYPFSMGISLTEGHFLSVIKIPQFMDQDFYRASPDIAPGNSGGPLLKKMGDGSYELIGLTTGGIGGYPFMSVFTGIEDIKEYLKVAAPETLGEKAPETLVSPNGR